ncbi:hypothetical protein WJX73_010765 [Symbiochloris irregularis]|uniref:Exoribonuclease phosphorolytic domain-containing protein n=1 Tax=Symbiochloris irregularis TaxID=706552 RepID=A0AAW1PSG7_9CHLO
MDQRAGPGPGSSAPRRADGRTATQLRRYTCDLGLQEQADGSALWQQGGTHILAVVHGPTQPTFGPSARRADPERAVVQVNVRAKEGIQGHQQKAWQQFVRKAVEGIVIAKLHPKCLIKVVLQILSEDGAVLACLLSAASAALVDAGIPLTTSFVASSCALSSEGNILLDASAREEQEAQAVVCAAFAYHLHAPHDEGPSVGQHAMACDTSGRLSVASLNALLQATRLSCAQIALLAHASLADVYKS